MSFLLWCPAELSSRECSIHLPRRVSRAECFEYAGHGQVEAGPGKRAPETPNRHLGEQFGQLHKVVVKRAVARDAKAESPEIGQGIHASDPLQSDAIGRLL